MSTWENQYEFLSSYTRFNSISLDLPGHGGSEGNAFSSIKDYSDFVYGFIKNLDLKELIPAGHSMGGRILQMFCLDHPEYTIGCILAGTGIKIRITKATFNTLRNDFRQFCEMATKNSFSGSAGENIKKSFYKRLYSSCKESCWNDMIACDHFDVGKSIDHISIPSLIIAGDEDVLAPARYSRELYKHIKDSKLAIIKGAGHFMMIEKSSAFNTALQNFLNFL